MNNIELAGINKALAFFFNSKRGKYFLCPDGVPRKLDDIRISNDHVDLAMSAAMSDQASQSYHWSSVHAERNFKCFTKLSQGQAQGRTDLPKPIPAPPAVAEVLPAVTPPSDEQAITPTVTTLAQQVIQELDPRGHLDTITEGLMEAFNKVRTNAVYVGQARVQNDIAKTVISSFATKAELIKSLRQNKLA